MQTKYRFICRLNIDSNKNKLNNYPNANSNEKSNANRNSRYVH